MDFESAAMLAFQEVFQIPDEGVDGCAFHMGQSCWRKIQDLGLAPRYADKEDPQFASVCRSIPALAFVPVADVREAFTEVTQYAEEKYPGVLDEYFDYFERTYIGRIVGGVQRQALFPLRSGTNTTTPSTVSPEPTTPLKAGTEPFSA